MSTSEDVHAIFSLSITRASGRRDDLVVSLVSSATRSPVTPGRIPPLGIPAPFPQKDQRPTSTSPKFPQPPEGMALIFLTTACLGARAFWLQGEGNPEEVEGALLERGRRRDFVELDRRI